MEHHCLPDNRETDTTANFFILALIAVSGLKNYLKSSKSSNLFLKFNMIVKVHLKICLFCRIGLLISLK